MRLLVDTQAILWWLDDEPSLGGDARAAMSDRDNEVFVSSLSFAEIAIKQSLGKLNGPFISDDLLAEQGMKPLVLTPRHARRVGELPPYHGDPFDRLIIAQALVEGLTIVTSDRRFGQYDVPVLST